MMKRALLGMLLVTGCGVGEELPPPPPDVMGAWQEVFGRDDSPPSLFPADEQEHRHALNLAFVRDLSPEELAHALTHVYFMRTVREQVAPEDADEDRWHGDPNHLQSVWMVNGQPAALERTALEYLQVHRGR